MEAVEDRLGAGLLIVGFLFGSGREESLELRLEVGLFLAVGLADGLADVGPEHAGAVPRDSEGSRRKSLEGWGFVLLALEEIGGAVRLTSGRGSGVAGGRGLAEAVELADGGVTGGAEGV